MEKQTTDLQILTGFCVLTYGAQKYTVTANKYISSQKLWNTLDFRLFSRFK